MYISNYCSLTNKKIEFLKAKFQKYSLNKKSWEIENDKSVTTESSDKAGHVFQISKRRESGSLQTCCLFWGKNWAQTVSVNSIRICGGQCTEHCTLNHFYESHELLTDICLLQPEVLWKQWITDWPILATAWRLTPGILENSFARTVIMGAVWRILAPSPISVV